MPTRSGIVYEVSFFVDSSVRDEFDKWLSDHVRDAIHMPGVAECNAFPSADSDDSRAGRVCLYVLDNDDALDEFLDAAEMESDVTSRFGDLVSVGARFLREDHSVDEAPAVSPDCLNCGTRLKGQYCGHCGQRSRSRLISLWELLSDAFGDLLEIDSRLWKTLVPLMIRPGQLTRDYLKGRRARFMPPFRMYLVLSLLFFVVAFFDPHEQLNLFFEPEPEATTEEIASETRQQKLEILDELLEEGILAGGDELPEDVVDELSELRLQLGEDGDLETDCNLDASDVADLEKLPGWIARRLTPERLKRVCEKTQIDGGRAFVDKMLDNIPAALIVLLPLMAFVLKALYPLSRRYYVEHLLFFVHFHAFFFLILTLQILLMRLSTLLHIPEAVPILIIVATSFYVPVYLFKSMRRVYEQGGFVTSLKFVALLVAYLSGFIATMLGVLAIAAFSI
jgi:hypothetical protein